MDCEKFDQSVIDALYDELDELTSAELERHVEGCSRCAGVLAGLTRAREVSQLPLEEPSAGLEARILAAERAAARRAPWYSKFYRGAAWAGSLAMRPQFAMAALFMLVVGSSLLLLRARPGTMGSPIQITQRGEPGPIVEDGDKKKALAPARAPANEPKQSARDESHEAKDDQLRSGGAPGNLAGPMGEETAAATAESMSPPPAIADPGPPSPMASAGKGGSASDLAAAESVREQAGCADALPRFMSIQQRYPGSPDAATAKRSASECQASLGKVAAQPVSKPAKPATTAAAPPAPPATGAFTPDDAAPPSGH